MIKPAWLDNATDKIYLAEWDWKRIMCGTGNNTPHYKGILCSSLAEFNDL